MEMTNKEAADILKSIIAGGITNHGRANGKSGSIMKYMEALMRAVNVLENTPEWVECKTQLPDKLDQYLTCDEHGNIHIFIYNPRSKVPFYIDENDPRYYVPKYWMPLPKAPSERLL